MLGSTFLVAFSNVAQLLTFKCQSRTQQSLSEAVLHLATGLLHVKQLLKFVKATPYIKAAVRSLILRPLEVHRAVSAKALKNAQLKQYFLFLQP